MGTGTALHDSGGLRTVARRRALLALPVLAIPLPTRAQDETWTVRAIPVDVAGPDAVAARDRAIADASRQAWGQLLDRIAAPDRAAALRTLPGPEIEAMVQGIEIDDERVAPNRYRASLSVAFDPDRVRNRLAGAGGGAGGGGPVAAVASFRGIRQWGELQQRLAASPAVARFELRVLRVAEAEMTLVLTEDPARAAETMAANGLRLDADPAGGPWRLRLAAP